MSSEVQVWLEWAAIIILIGFSGLFSGLNLGLMSLDPVGLEIIMASDNKSHINAANKIKPLRRRGNWLLCTLLLGNVAVNAELSILLADKTSGTIGFIVSTALIVIFGEIVPQALCSRYALEIGAKTVWIVWPLMFAMAILAWPISWILDRILGEEMGTMYSNKELAKLVDITAKRRPDSMDRNTASILKGALNLNNQCVNDVFTEMKAVFWLNENEILTFDLLTKIFKLGHSRIPIFREMNSVKYCIGLLYVKDLILVDPDDNIPITKILQTFDHHHTPIDVWRYDDLQKTLQLFISSRMHLAFVKDQQEPEKQQELIQYVGIITLEDVIEEILKKELVDEYDNFVDHNDLKSTTPRLKEINWSNSLFNNHHLNNDSNTSNNISSFKKPSQPQMIPTPVKIEDYDENIKDPNKVIAPSQNVPYMIRHSSSFKLLGLNQLKQGDENDDDMLYDDQSINDDYQYLQVKYKSVQIQIKCLKDTIVETVDGIHHGAIEKQILLDGHKIMDITDNEDKINDDDNDNNNNHFKLMDKYKMSMDQIVDIPKDI